MSVLRTIVLIAVMITCAGAVRAADESDVNFNRDIRPLLASKCFACHGPDEEQRQADLRLDQRDAAIDAGVISPDTPDESEFLRRIESSDPDERMPPPDSGPPLTPEQTELLRRWIAGGAPYDRHWAFVAPVRPPVPPVRLTGWPRNEIDRYVLSRLEQVGLEPSLEADPYTLIRRVSLDLTGLPPTPEQADEFAANPDPAAYEQLVDRLLESEQYGERWARDWLDLARYADTNGYEKDRERSIWAYRDWVIKALNADLPFDQFTIEQLAGDMLPDATESQQIATGFHRNTMLNEEGGIDPLEFRFYAMVDRVATTGTAWLGLTTGCAQCHTHKYDPITHTDFYRLLALLNNADEPDLQLQSPRVLARRREIEAQIAALEEDLANQFPPGDLEAKFNDWLEQQVCGAVTWSTLRPSVMETNLPRLEVLDDGSIFSTGDITKRDVFTLTFDIDESMLPLTALRLEVLPDPRLPAGGPGRCYYEGRKGDFFLSELTATIDGAAVPLGSAAHSYGKISIGSGTADAANVLDGDGDTGWSTAERAGAPHQLVVNLQQPVTSPGSLQVQMLFERHFAASLGRFRFSAASASRTVAATRLPVEIEPLLVRDSATWTADERERLRHTFLRMTPEVADARQPIDELRKQLPDLPTTMVLQERPADNPRITHRHHRGEYLSPREEVPPALPSLFADSAGDGPTDRLSFARWLVSRDNPLVARVTVNRAWQAFFGAGLVKTSADFGTQSDPPTHPELLDWLACEFMDRGWSLKQLHRLIVTSAAYRQQSIASPELQRRDPHNELLARGPRYRVDAEIVRDMMLKASGLLSPKMYGPSVYPPQPASVTALAYGSMPWTASDGEDRYRRSLYTFSKRTAPFAAYAVFDAPTGENCVARRDRSNTPLQALTLLNDEMYQEMARALALLAMTDARSDDEIASRMFRRLLTRPPGDDELMQMLAYVDEQAARLSRNELSAADIAGDDAGQRQAAWTMLARVLMNLDETITKP